MIAIFNNDCFELMNYMIKQNQKTNLILTSPPYNTGRVSNSKRALQNHEARYDIHLDNMTTEEYREWVVKLFNAFDKILEKNGVVLWNVSYGNDATVNTNGLGVMWLTIADIITHTNFTVADKIVWKKKSALPSNTSKNKLTRICEDVFVFVRKEEFKTFNSAKKVVSTSHTGQNFYENKYNFIEAKNNDGSCKLNKATFSSDLVTQILDMYALPNCIVYDPFNGTGTTGVSCIKKGYSYIGSEISEQQCEYSKERLQKLTDEKVGVYKVL